MLVREKPRGRGRAFPVVAARYWTESNKALNINHMTLGVTSTNVSPSGR